MHQPASSGLSHVHGVEPIGGMSVHHIRAMQPEAMPLNMPQGEKLPLTRGQDWRRWVAGSLAACVVVVLILYELSLRFPRPLPVINCGTRSL
eukprot:s1205_g19.t3